MMELNKSRILTIAECCTLLTSAAAKKCQHFWLSLTQLPSVSLLKEAWNSVCGVWQRGLKRAVNL